MICPNCDSKLCYVRIKTKEIVCRYCGKISKQKTAKDMLKNFSGLSNERT